jgi:hypothetical protein
LRKACEETDRRSAGDLLAAGGDAPGNRIRRAADLPASRNGRHGLQPLAGGWLSGKYRKGQEVSGPGSAARSRRLPARYASDPSNAAKLDAADALGALGALADETGITLIQMAVAFVTRHPAVTSAIIGPRTMEHLDAYLAADRIGLSGDLLDRIDQIVRPAVTINAADYMWESGARCGIPPPAISRE